MVIAIVICSVLPFVVRIITMPEPQIITLHYISLLANTIAVLSGIWILQNVGTYPGVESTSYIAPSFSISYGLVAMFLFLDRIEYNRFILISGYFISIILFYIITSRTSMSRKSLVAVTPFTELGDLQNHASTVFVSFVDPYHPPQGLDVVVTDLRNELPKDWERQLAKLALSGVPVYHIKHFGESLSGKVDLEHLSETNFGSLSPLSAYFRIKYALDIAAAFILLPIIGPLMLLCAIAIRLDSPGPVLFRQKRVGYRGELFTVFKLRTMTSSGAATAEHRDAAMTKTNDERITRVGRFLRTTRLDELPQLLNIMRGEMSWIGPRPEAVVLSEWYDKEISFYLYRHIVKPGLTGWAQVNQGHVADVDDVRDKLKYDLYYIKNFSFWLDALIVLRTVRTMITGFGAR